MEGAWVPESLLERRASRPSGTPTLDFISVIIFCCGKPLHLGDLSVAADSISLTITPPENRLPPERVLMLWMVGIGVPLAVQ